MPEQIQEILQTPQPTQPVQPVPVESKKKPNLKIIVILLIVVLLLAVGKIYAKKFLNKPKACTSEAQICPDGSAVGRTGPNCEFAPCPNQIPSTIPTPNETANWKTYISKYGRYSLKYSDNWIIAESTDTQEALNNPTPENALSLVIKNINNNSSINSYITVGVSKVDLLNANVEHKKKTLEKWGSNGAGQISQTSLSGADGYKLVWNLLDSSSSASLAKRINYAVEKDGLLYDIALSVSSKTPNKDNVYIEGDQILSTFKFTNQATVDELSSWKTSVNSSLSFSLKYPSTWFFPAESIVLSNYDMSSYPSNLSFPKDSAKCDFGVYNPDDLMITNEQLFIETNIKVFKGAGKDISGTGGPGPGLGNNVFFIIKDDVHKPIYLLCYSYSDTLNETMKKILSTFKFTN